MGNFLIRKVNATDIKLLQKIAKTTFFETFSAENSEENMQNYLNEKFSEKQINSELINKNSVFYFALFNDEIIGYLKLNIEDAQTETKLENAVEIERIYVLKNFHGKEVGKILLDKAIETAKSIHADFLWLGVWEKNERAIHFYSKNGFIAFDQHVFILGDDRQTDILMKLDLRNAKK